MAYFRSTGHWSDFSPTGDTRGDVMTWWRVAQAARRVERGTSLAEYALILSGVSIGAVAVVRLFGEWLTATFGDLVGLL